MTIFSGFPKKLISALVCQNDNKPLVINKVINGDYILNGELFCPSCGCRYEIIDGILNLLDKQNRIDDILKSEIKSRDEQAEGYNKRLANRFFKEVAPTLKNLENTSGKKIIEYGCGTGRFTLEIEKSCEEILAIDFSEASLKYLSRNLKTGNVGLVLADAIQIKTKDNYFDIALATQFFEHIPSEKQRENFLGHMQKTLKSGGEIICTVYNNDWRRRWKKLPKEGLHAGQIFYYYFDKNEVNALFKKYFKIRKIQLIDITLPLEARLRLPEKVGGIISTFSQYIFPINRLGHLLLIKAKK